ncbi:carboxylating nicotinate-nucleotide diphosphorylase [Babesia caballi]|uniref:Carboxylating nicotinate-nucleotide diphosphorylase n=1 Tax=Babesia caballi TaxID=5871 RepID=A0AAV4LNP5_BABCB|nr:carboxylating nicotinate-nucleotide diphosphorylase [Babesia caballi]
MVNGVMEKLASIAGGGLAPGDARERRERQAEKLAAKIERRRAQVKGAMKVLRQYKGALAAQLERSQRAMLEAKNELDIVMADYRTECRKLAEEDSRDLQEFYLWAKDEIMKCADAALERAPVEDNTAIMKALQVMLKNC